MTAKQLTGTVAPDTSQYVTLTDGAGNLVNTAASGLTIGSSPIIGGATTQVLFNLAGKVSSDSGFTYVGSNGIVTLGGVLNVASVNSISTTGIFLRDNGLNVFGLGSGNKVTWSSSTDGVGAVDLGLSRNGVSILEVNTGTPGTFAALKCSSITTTSGTLHTTSAALTNNAAAQTATMTNGPTAGNPTKWIPINDNGTTRNIPAW